MLVGWLRRKISAGNFNWLLSVEIFEILTFTFGNT